MKRFLYSLFASMIVLLLLPTAAFADEIGPWGLPVGDDAEAPLAEPAEEVPAEAGSTITNVTMENVNTNLVPGQRVTFSGKLVSVDVSDANPELMGEYWATYDANPEQYYPGSQYDAFACSANKAFGLNYWSDLCPSEKSTVLYVVAVKFDGNYSVPQDMSITVDGKTYVGHAFIIQRNVDVQNNKGINYFIAAFDIRVKTAYPVPLYRMYNTKTSEHLWTRSKGEYDSCGSGNYADWKAEGVAWYVTKKSSKPVYRLYNTKSGDHHYTTSASEKDKLIASGQWRDEGIAFYSANNKDTGTISIYRVYNSRLKRGQHHYTKSATERDSLVKNNGWKDEGVGFYGYSSAKPAPSTPMPRPYPG